MTTPDPFSGANAVRSIMELAAHSLRVRQRSLLAWCLALAGLMAMMVLLYPSMTQTVDYNELIEAYPEDIKKAFGLDEMSGGLNTAIGFLNAEMFGLLLPLSIVFLPTGYVSRALSAAEERGFLETVLSAPIRRWHVILSTALAAATGLAIALLAMLAITLITAAIVGVELGAGELARSCASLWPLASLFAVIALVASAAAGRQGRPAAVAAGSLVLMYLLNIVAQFSRQFEWVKHFSIFHYYADWLQNGVSIFEVAVVLGICGALTYIACLLFERRDIAG